MSQSTGPNVVKTGSNKNTQVKKSRAPYSQMPPSMAVKKKKRGIKQ